MTTQSRPEPMVIAGGRVMTEGGDPHAPEIADILIENGRISRVEAGLAGEMGDHASGIEVMDARNKLVIPGFVNAHYHSHDTLAKGMMEETPLETWRLLALPPAYPKRSREEIKARTLLGALECLRSGITTVQDMVTLYPFDPDHLTAVIEAYEEIGIRAVVALQYADRRGIDTIPFWREVFPKELHGDLSSATEPDRKFDQLGYFVENYVEGGGTSDRITWALGPSAPERCSTELIKRTKALSEKYDLPVFTHIYESKGMALQARQEYPEHGGSLIRRLEREGLLGPRLNLAHSVWLLSDEIEILAKTRTRVVINPLSNMKLKSGIPPIRALQDAGISLGLGCDNCSCSDAQNMFQAMKLFCLMTAISHSDAGPEQSGAAFEAATAGGARAIGRGDDLGCIEPGRVADLVLIDLNDPSFIPLNSARRQLVYAEGGRGVKTVVVGGRVVIEDGRLQTIDETKLLDRILAVVPQFQRDYAVIKARVERMRPYLEEAHRRIWAQDVGGDRLFKDPI